jgi:transposase-like protein
VRGSRQLKGRKAAIVLVAVEKRGDVSNHTRMAVVPDFKRTTRLRFVTHHVAPGSTVYTDGLKGFKGLQAAGVRHVPRTQPLRGDLRRGAPSVVRLSVAVCHTTMPMETCGGEAQKPQRDSSTPACAKEATYRISEPTSRPGDRG